MKSIEQLTAGRHATRGKAFRSQAYHVTTNLELTSKEQLLTVGLASHHGGEIGLRGVNNA
jgi:hypothetical protein